MPRQYAANGRQARLTGNTRHKVGLGQALSPLETRVAKRLVQLDEPTNAKAAQDLGLTPDAVRQHLQRIYRKLGVSTRLGMYRAMTEDPVGQRCKHCGEPIRPAARFTGRDWLHVGTGTWWCAPTTIAEPRVDTED